MIRFVEKPHLPQGEVRQIIIGEKYKNMLENALFEQNIAPIWFKNNDFVDERLSGHCDLMAAHLGGNRLAVQSSVANNCKLINNIELICTENPSRPEYPYDAGLNICIVDEKLIYNPKSANMQIVCERSRIERFLNERDIAPVYLTNAPMFDIGSAIPITEEI